MANPRQRRKARSSSYKPVSHSRRAKKNLKKLPPIKGPKAIQDAWDKKKTLKENYAALGLMHDMGTAPAPTVTPTAQPVEGDDLPAGFGRIIRDDEGNVTGVEIGGENEEEADTTPWGAPMEDWGTEKREEGKKTALVQELEELAARPEEKMVRTATVHEEKWLRRLVAKHGQDLGRMARDRRENVWQKTEGELRRAIAKAGGFEKLSGVVNLAV